MNFSQSGILRKLINFADVSQLNNFIFILGATFILFRLYSLLRSMKHNNAINDINEYQNNSKKVGTSNKQFGDKKIENELDVLTENDDFHDEMQLQEVPYIEYTEKEMYKRSLMFYENMKIRRSVRCFSSRSVSLKLLQNLIKTAGCAPSGANLQPWTFCVVANAAKKRSIREIVEYEEHLNYSRRMGTKWVSDVQHLKVNWHKPYLTEAPYLLVVMKQYYQILKDGSRQPTYYNEISTAIATGFLLAAIQNAGLVTVTTTPLNAGSAIRDLLERPVNEKVMLLLPVGYPANGARIPNIQRKSLEEIVRIY